MLIISLVLIWSCQKTVHVTEVKNADPNPSQMGGTDNAGGGNGISGKPLDTFIETNFTQIPAFAQVISPLIRKLKEIDPKVAGDFYHLALNRDWYFVPVRLDMISGKILGSYAKTDQLALQDLNKIWVNSIIYNEMDVKNQAALIVHEFMMGLRLIQYQHRQDLCIAESSDLLLKGLQPEDMKLYQQAKASCRNTYPKVVGSISGQFSLNADDYDLIRKITALLLTEEPSNMQEAVLLIRSTKLRQYN